MNETSFNRLYLDGVIHEVRYHNDMVPLRLKPESNTLAGFLKELQVRLLYDERLEVDGTVINVYKTYGL